MRHSFLLFPVAVAAASMLSACAAASGGAKAAPVAAEQAPPASSAAPMATAAPLEEAPSREGPGRIEDELAAFAKAEREIGALVAGGEVEKRDTNKKAPKQEPRAAELSQGAGEACSTACRALSSMQRSAEHLCALAGDGDARCTDARGRLQKAAERVRAACPACAAR